MIRDKWTNEVVVLGRYKTDLGKTYSKSLGNCFLLFVEHVFSFYFAENQDGASLWYDIRRQGLIYSCVNFRNYSLYLRQVYEPITELKCCLTKLNLVNISKLKSSKLFLWLLSNTLWVLHLFVFMTLFCWDTLDIFSIILILLFAIEFFPIFGMGYLLIYSQKIKRRQCFHVIKNLIISCL